MPMLALLLLCAGLFGRDADEVVGRFITDAFTESGARAIQALMAGVRASGQPDEVGADTGAPLAFLDAVRRRGIADALATAALPEPALLPLPVLLD